MSKRQEITIDAADRPLGRLASEIAFFLMGKNSPAFERHLDAGCKVTVKNAALVKLTGKKAQQKVYYRHSNYPGGLKTTPARVLLQQPAKMIRLAVAKMLPKNGLRKNRLLRLRFK